MKEIAYNMDISTKAVESLLSRARPVFEDVFFSLNGTEILNRQGGNL
jgi:hypothetical protein